jgi:hypothetical protein
LIKEYSKEGFVEKGGEKEGCFFMRIYTSENEDFFGQNTCNFGFIFLEFSNNPVKRGESK